MSTADLLLATTIPSWNDELFQLEMRIARRADELAAGRRRGRKGDREVWRRAEREVMDTGNSTGGSPGFTSPSVVRRPRANATARARNRAACGVEG